MRRLAFVACAAVVAAVLVTSSAGASNSDLVTGGGRVQPPGPSTPELVAFSLSAHGGPNGPQGTCRLVDAAANVEVRCLDVSSLVVTGPSATIAGIASVNDTLSLYQIEVSDGGAQGIDTFTFSSDSYAVSGIVTKGNIQTH
jgi:hypothetical protein